jgi:hypothetical protein
MCIKSFLPEQLKRRNHLDSRLIFNGTERNNTGGHKQDLYFSG